MSRLRTVQDLQVKRTFLYCVVCPAILITITTLKGSGSANQATKANGHNLGWPVYGGQPENDHYSQLMQINRRNVARLEKVWEFDTGETGGLQTNPIVVGNVLYAYSPTQKVIALNAATGKLLWKFDSGIESHQPNRGLTYWTDGKNARLLASVMNFLYALDPATGKPIESFGENGRIDLRKDLDAEDYRRQAVAMTTPGVIYQDMIIVGFRTSETPPAPHGDIRAYDVHTGKLRWSFHTIPHPGESGYETWPPGAWKTAGSANNWAGMAVDARRGIVYVPTGSAVPDFYGGERLGNNLYADSLLALDAHSGKLLWHFQGVHHDVWDRDFPSPPTLLSVVHNGKKVDAIAQTTKQGFVYVFDRVTGKPLFPIVENPYPQSTVPGEHTSPTQPLPLTPAPFARQRLTMDMLTQRTPQAHAWAEERFRSFYSNGQFIPLSVDKQTVVFPGFDGGAEWGGSAADPKSGVIYVNANDIAWTGGLTANNALPGSGAAIYLNQCATCHGDDRRGSPPAMPSLIDVDQRLSTEQIAYTIHSGKGRMPAFPGIENIRLARLIHYIRTGREVSPAVEISQPPTPESQQPMSVVGANVYRQRCAICHGDDRSGNEPAFPRLVGVGQRLSSRQLTSIIREGKGRMPSFSSTIISEDQMNTLLLYLGTDPAANAQSIKTQLQQDSPALAAQKREMESADDTDLIREPYRFTGYRKFLDPDGYPAVVPPWGTLNAIDLNSGKYLWKIPLGEYPELAQQGLKNTGTENYGGPILTAGGLVFIGATMFDKKIRAFDSRSGALLWQYQLPYAGVATPATYMVDGKQYVVIGAGGGRDPKSRSGGMYVAFALP